MNDKNKTKAQLIAELEQLRKEVSFRSMPDSLLISTASHEFRTPLTSIKLYTDLLAMYGKNLDTEKYMLHLYKIQKAVGNMTELINDVLTISKAETGFLVFNPVRFNLRKFCFELIKEQKLNINKHHILKLQYNSEQKHVFMDKKILKSILTNLISNALKYSPEGGEIAFTVEFEDSGAIFTIRDSGIGIPENDQKNLFEYFYRGENITNIPGTGLGLAIVKRSVDLHKGVIEFCSRVNEGTTFKITLPAK